MSIATVPTPSRWFQYESITSQPYVDYGIIVAINNDNTVNVDIQGYDLSATNKIILERVKYPAGYTPKYGDLVAIQWDGNVPIIARTIVSGEGIDIADLLMFYNDFNIINSNKWNETYWGTIKYRSTGAPTNNPVPTGIEIQSNPNATINIKLTWDTYTQGEKQADLLYLFWKKGSSPLGSPTVLDSCIAFNVNTTSPSYYIFEGVNPADNYSFGIAAARRTENGIEIGPIQSPTANPDWQDVTSGTPNYTANINGTPASTVATAVTNFNTRNDRKSTVPADPVIATNGSAIDHTINMDGSADISFEWQFTGTGDAYDIDGFIVYVYSSDSSSPYTFGTSPNLEKTYPIPPEKRAHILYGVPANKYYTFGVQAYRIVDQDISPNGILKSNIVKPSLSSENPYRPSNEVAFSGDVVGTIGGVDAGIISGVPNYLSEQLGSQIAGFKRNSDAYKQDGSKATVHVPRYEYHALPYPVWQDLFDTDQLSQYTSGGDTPATWTVSGGVLTGTGGAQATLIKKDLLLQDCEIVVNCDQAYNGGIIARYQDNNNYYLLALSDDSGQNPSYNLRLLKRVGGTFTQFASADVTWPRGTSKQIKFTLHGSRLEAYFGGVKVISVTDTTFTGGGVGLRNYSFTAFRALDFTVYYAQQGVMAEEDTTNLLTANQSSVETDTTGFGVSGSATISRDTTRAWHGSACLKVTTNGAGANEGFYVKISTSSQGTYIGQVRLQGTGRVWIATRIIYSDGTFDQGAYVYADLTDNWQRVVSNAITSNSSKTVSRVMLFVRTYGTQAITFYADGLQLEAKPYATSWTLGGSTRSAEVLTVPTAGVFQKGNWTVKLRYTPQTVTYVGNVNKVLWNIHIDANNWYMLGVGWNGEPYGMIMSGGTRYSIVSASGVITPGNTYFITLAGNGSTLLLCCNGAQVGSGSYVEPVGTLPANMKVGSWDTNVGNSVQANGIISDFAVMNKAQTLAKHQAEYNSGRPLSVDENTTLLMSMNGTLRQTARNRLLREQGTFTIADASTTKNPERATHIVPKGWTSAQTTILQAISELPSDGGKIVLLDGTYVVDGSIILPSNVTLEGQGACTVIKLKSSTGDINIFVNSDYTSGNTAISLRNFLIDGNKANQTATYQCATVFVNVNDLCLQNLIVQNMKYMGLTVSNASSIIITGCICTSCGWGGLLLGDLAWGGVTTTTVSGNICRANLKGIWAILTQKSVFAGNVVTESAREGLYFYVSSHNAIQGNECIKNGQEADNTYAHILLESNSDYNNLQNNICRNEGSVRARYGIRIGSSDCDGNVVTSNDLCDSGATASFSDSGTGTITTPGNRL